MPRADTLLRDESSMRLNAVNGQENRPPLKAPGGMQAQKETANEPDLGLTIRRLRESRRLSLKEVAARSGLTQSFLTQGERNLTNPSAASLPNIPPPFAVPCTALSHA